MIGILLESKPENTDLYSLSVSKVKTFKDCKAKFKFNYIERLPKLDREYLILGKFAHQILENFHKHLLNGREDPYNIIMTDSFKSAYEEYKEKLTKEQIKECKEMCLVYIKKLNESRLNNTLPTFTGVEKEFFVNIDNKVLLVGFVDRSQIDPDGILHISDYKTTKNISYLKKDYFQLKCYAYIYLLNNPEIEVIRTSYILLRHNMDTLVKEFKRKDLMDVENTFIDYYKKIQEEKLFRASPSKLCDYCDYLEHCDAGKKFLGKETKDINWNMEG